MADKQRNEADDYFCVRFSFALFADFSIGDFFIVNLFQDATPSIILTFCRTIAYVEKSYQHLW